LYVELILSIKGEKLYIIRKRGFSKLNSTEGMLFSNLREIHQIHNRNRGNLKKNTENSYVQEFLLKKR